MEKNVLESNIFDMRKELILLKDPSLLNNFLEGNFSKQRKIFDKFNRFRKYLLFKQIKVLNVRIIY
jgi:hypothetical protein